jgi:hypothetical protein
LNTSEKLVAAGLATVTAIAFYQGSHEAPHSAEDQLSSLAQGLAAMAIERYQEQPDPDKFLDGDTVTLMVDAADADGDTMSMEVILDKPEGGTVAPDSRLTFDPALLDPSTVTSVELKEINEAPSDAQSAHYTSVGLGPDGEWDGTIGYYMDTENPLLLTYTSRDNSGTMSPTQFDANAAQSLDEFRRDLRGTINPDIDPAA